MFRFLKMLLGITVAVAILLVTVWSFFTSQIMHGDPPPLWVFSATAFGGATALSLLLRSFFARWLTRRNVLFLIATFIIASLPAWYVYSQHTYKKIFSVYFDKEVPKGLALISGYHGAWLDPTAELGFSAETPEVLSALVEGYSNISKSILKQKMVFTGLRPDGAKFLEQKELEFYAKETISQVQSDKRGAQWRLLKEYIMVDKKSLKAYYYKAVTTYSKEKPAPSS
jgi:hypothetical protein